MVNAEFTAMQGEIEAAIEKITKRKFIFDNMAKDDRRLMQHAEALFSQQQFALLRFSTQEIKLASNVLNSAELPSELSEMQKIHAVIMSLLDPAGMEDIIRQLLMMLPGYVAEGNYQDAWLIYHSAWHMIEETETPNPFLLSMYLLGLKKLKTQADEEMAQLLSSLDIDTGQVKDKSMSEISELVTQRLSDPEKKQIVDTFYDSHPDMLEAVEAKVDRSERLALEWVEKDDPGPFRLTEEEIDQWYPLLEEKLQPYQGQLEQLLERSEDGGEAPDEATEKTRQILVKIFISLAGDMVEALFTPDRLKTLDDDITAFRNQALHNSHPDEADASQGAFMILSRDEPLRENPLLMRICFAGLFRRMMVSTENETDDGSEDEDENKA